MYFPEEDYTTTQDEHLGKKSDLNQIKPLDPVPVSEVRRRDIFSDTGSANAFGTIQYGDRLESTTRPAHQQIHSKKGEEEEDPCRRVRLKRDISQ